MWHVGHPSGGPSVQQPYFRVPGASLHQFPTRGLVANPFLYDRLSWTYGIGLFTDPIIGAGNVKEHEAAKYGLIVTTYVKLTPDHIVPLFSPRHFIIMMATVPLQESTMVRTPLSTPAEGWDETLALH